ncbi:CLUMA_CG003044, isoform A [Clunio marinus]|uniref:CLUMA_CG003044, isoform A n=1 Tax=Clunio marinus TaxID=568069 RepID=A0A1J1HMK8_9DIPT|nr:CLUMA_CG003044, isoform A [Clunio marinus]
MAKLLLQTVERTEFIELLHGFKDDPNVEEMSQFFLESYLNTPDKSRNETPLHFASKFGAADVVEVLITYPLCKMKPNVQGKEPKDIICERDPNAKPEVKEAIKKLLKERSFCACTAIS